MDLDTTRIREQVADGREGGAVARVAYLAAGGLRSVGNFVRTHNLRERAGRVGGVAVAGALFVTKALVHATNEAVGALAGGGEGASDTLSHSSQESERMPGPLGEKQKAFIHQWLPKYDLVDDLNTEHANVLSEKIVTAIGEDPHGDNAKMLNFFFLNSDLGIDNQLDIKLAAIAASLNDLPIDKRRAIVNETLGVEPKEGRREKVDTDRQGLENAMLKAGWNDTEKRSLLKLLGMDKEMADEAEVDVRLALEKIDKTLKAVKNGYLEEDKFKEWYKLLDSLITKLSNDNRALNSLDKYRSTINLILDNEPCGKYTKFDYQKDSVAAEVISLLDLKAKYKTRNDKLSRHREKFVGVGALAHISLMNIKGNVYPAISAENSLKIEDSWYSQEARREVIKLIRTLVKQNNRKKDEQLRLKKLELANGNPGEGPKKRGTPKGSKK